MTEPVVYEFGDVRVDLQRMGISVRGEPVPLEPKSFDVLVYLIEHRERLVGKDDLLDAVWGADTFVTPNALTRAVAQVRRAIGDDAHNARYIETVAKRGYRFLAPVTVANGGDGATPAPTAAPAPAPAARSRGRLLVTVVSAAAALAAAGAAWWARPPSGPPEAPGAAGAFSPPWRVTTRGGVNTWPALSPDGRAVAYVSDRSGDLEISVSGLAAGAREITITNDGGQNVQPEWSRDGQWLAFHSRKRGGVWIMPATGGTPQQVVEFGSDPTWAPDGRRLAFTSDVGGGASQSTIWTVLRDGSDRRALTRIGDPPGGHRQPAWSHDGRVVAFLVTRGGFPRAEVWVAPAAGGPPRRISPEGGGGAEPQFAPGDRALYWATGPRGDGVNAGRLWRQDLDAAGGPVGPPSEVLPLYDHLEGLSVAGDGSLAYSLTSSDMNLWAIDLRKDGSATEPVRLTEEQVRNGHPEYSPDGRIAFVQHGLDAASLRG